MSHIRYLRDGDRMATQDERTVLYVPGEDPVELRPVRPSTPLVDGGQGRDADEIESHAVLMACIAAAIVGIALAYPLSLLVIAACDALGAWLI
jgi:hypothetical protein